MRSGTPNRPEPVKGERASLRPAAVLAVAGCLALVISACSGNSKDIASHPSAGTSAAAQGTTPSDGPTRAVHPRARGKAFVPRSVSAVSAKRVWVLGERRCVKSSCRAVAYRSGDGGTSWQRLHLPSTPFRSDPSAANSGVSQIAFANDTTGWMFGPDLWVTHTGGDNWRRVDVPGDVEGLAAGRGAVWAMVGACTPGQGCEAQVMLRAQLPNGRFDPVTLPGPLLGGGPVPDLAASGDTVAVLTNLPPMPPGDHNLVEVTTDGGATWVSRRAPCLNELGGELAVSGTSVWAVCPTGSLAHVYVTTGGPFKTVDVFGGPLPSFTDVTALAPDTALAVVLGARVFRTTNAGVSWQRVQLPPQARQGEGMVTSFSSPGHGYAVTIGATGSGLMRSDDGGQHWRPIMVP